MQPRGKNLVRPWTCGPPAGAALATRREDRPAGRSKSRAFTLVELLTVIVIIALLMSILVPSITAILSLAHATKTAARISALSNGANAYKSDTQYYPGIRHENRLTGSVNPESPTYTGSQVLAATMFAYLSYTDIGSANPSREEDKDYVTYNRNWLIDHSNRRDTLGDAFPDQMPICYYPSRLTGPGKEAPPSGYSGSQQVFSTFRYKDNDAYTGTTGQQLDKFTESIVDERFKDSDMARRGQDFLLIGPGPDKIYFTSDDVRN